MPLPRPAASSSHFAEVEAVASQYRGVTISIFRPGAKAAGTRYDPEADTGAGTGRTPIIAGRPARAQQMRNPQENSNLDQYTTKRAFLFETEIRADDPIIAKGDIVRVTEVRTGDTTLVHFAFEVQSALNSSEAPLRSIFTITEADASPAVA